MGFLQNNPGADKDAVWNNAYGQRDYPLRHGDVAQIDCDYVFGRMMKLRFRVEGNKISHPDHQPRADYQAWCYKYPTFDSLFDAGETESKTPA